MNKENKFKVIDKDGKEIEFEVLFTFESDETHKNYMVYTDNSTDEEGNVRVFASVFVPDAELVKQKNVLIEQMHQTRV